MNIVDVSFVAVFVSAVAAFAVGSVWYSPALFAKQWMKEIGITPGKITDAQKSEMVRSMVGMFIAELVMAYVLAHVLFYAGSFSGGMNALIGMQGAFWCWLGFVAAPYSSLVFFERKSWTYFAITSGHYLVGMLMMGAILGMWK